MSVWPIREPWVPLLPGLGHLQIRVAPTGHWAELRCTASLLFPWQPSERVCHSPLPRGHCRPSRRSGGHQVAEPRHCCDLVHPHHSLFPATSASRQGLSCWGWDSLSRLHREGTARPSFGKRGCWGSCSRFLGRANGVLLPPPHTRNR